MPINGGPSNGPLPSTAQVNIEFSQTGITFSGAGSQSTPPVHADNLPGFNVWVLQSSGAGAVSVQPQFANGTGVGGVPAWQNLVPAFAVAPGVPVLNNYRLGSRLYRLVITTTGAAVVQWRTTATPT